MQTRRGKLGLWDTTTAQCITSIDTKTTSLSRARALLLNGAEHSVNVQPSSILCATSSATHDSVAVYDVGRSPSSSAPALQTKPLLAHDVPGLPSSSTAVSPGWVGGIEPASKLGSTYVLVAYEAFAVQALYDLRNPVAPVTPAVVFPSSPQTTVAFSVTRNQSWIGTSEGHIMTTKILTSGNLVPTDQLDMFAHLREEAGDKTRISLEDPLEYKREVISCLESQSKLGIGALCFTPCSRVAIVGGWDAYMRCIDVLTRQTFSVVGYHRDSISAIDTDIQSGSIAVASRDSRISIWKPWW